MIKIYNKPFKFTPVDYCSDGKCFLYKTCFERSILIHSRCKFFFDLLEIEGRPTQKQISDYARKMNQETSSFFNLPCSDYSLSRLEEDISEYFNMICDTVNEFFPEILYEFLREHPEDFTEKEFLNYISDENKLTKISFSSAGKVIEEKNRWGEGPPYLLTHIEALIDKNESYLHENSGLIKKFWLGEKLSEGEKREMDACLDTIGTSTSKLNDLKNELREKQTKKP